jgi:hypothetical protein
VSLAWEAPQVSSYELLSTSRGLEELVSLARRGELSEVTRLISVEDMFGFCKVSWRWSQPASLTILPKSVAASSTPLHQLQEGDELYSPEGHPDGDLMEFVVWRLYARSRQLMVRTPERAMSLKRDLVAYVLAHPTDEPSASTARAYIERGLLGERFELYADGCLGGVSAPHDAMSHLLASAKGQPLEALSQLLALPPQRQRACVVFCSACLCDVFP